MAERHHLQSETFGKVVANLHLFPESGHLLACLLELDSYRLGQRGVSAVGFVPNALNASVCAQDQIERRGYPDRRLVHCHAATAPGGDAFFAAVLNLRVGVPSVPSRALRLRSRRGTSTRCGR